MAKVVERVKHPNAEVLTLRVLRVEFLEDVDFKLGGLPVLVDVLDDLEGDGRVCFKVSDSRNFSESSFSQRGQDFVSVVKDISGQVSQVSVGVVGDRRPFPLQDRTVQRRSVRL